MAKEKKLKLSDLIADDRNYNKGNEYGNSLIQKSLKELGAGRSILLDKNNRIIAGNKTAENAGLAGITNVIVVETTGNEVVAVRRNDIDLDSKKGREMALADNASAKANIEWDVDKLAEDWNNEEVKGWGINIDLHASNDEDEAQEYQYPDEELSTSHVRMVQLFLNTENEPIFRGYVEYMRQLTGASNFTEAVFKSVEMAYNSNKK